MASGGTGSDRSTGSKSRAGPMYTPATEQSPKGGPDNEHSDDRAPDGPGAAPPHVSPDGQDPRLRGAGERALQGRQDAGPGPSLRRRGGGRGRGLRGAQARRLHHQHAPRPRPLPGQGRLGEPDVRRAARQGGGLLPRQGRLHAHRGSRDGQPRRQRHRGRLRGPRHRRRALGQDAQERPGRGVLLRRRRARAGTALRGDEHGLALEAARHLRLREQPLRRVHPRHRDDRRARSWPAPARWACTPRAWTGRTCRRCTPR